jgi:hypothetical protein
MHGSKLVPDGVDPNSARIYAIVARAARCAVVFRRGPSRRVRLMLWHLASDTIEAGQWFKGRIYERRCDLTPAGDRLVYFAASFRRPFYSWTAISRPPYLTALALWPKGDCWGGGGLFHTQRHLRLNHRRKEMRLATGFALPRRFQVEPLDDHSGHGEDDPIMSLRMIRDGWAYVPYDGAVKRHGHRWRYLRTFDPPLTMQKPIDRRRRSDLLLRMHLHAIHERQARWYVETADLANQEGRTTFEFGRIDWADVDHNGDVRYAKDGCLFRLPRSLSHRGDDPIFPSLIADLNAMTFEPIETPRWAQRWR